MVAHNYTCAVIRKGIGGKWGRGQEVRGEGGGGRREGCGRGRDINLTTWTCCCDKLDSDAARKCTKKTRYRTGIDSSVSSSQLTNCQLGS